MHHAKSRHSIHARRDDEPVVDFSRSLYILKEVGRLRFEGIRFLFGLPPGDAHLLAEFAGAAVLDLLERPVEVAEAGESGFRQNVATEMRTLFRCWMNDWPVAVLNSRQK